MPITGFVSGSLGLTVVPTYQGPGDLITGWFQWGGFRAFSFATIGTAAIRLRRDSDQAESDFVTLAPNGLLDTGSISSFKGAANLFVTKVYDQSGNGNDLVQATAASQLNFTLASFGAFPTMFNTAGLQLRVATAGNVTQVPPFSLSIVSKIDTSAADNNAAFYGSSATSVQLLRPGFAGQNTALLYCGAVTTFNPTFTDNVMHASNATLNGASSTILIDGASSSGTVGNNDWNGTEGIVMPAAGASAQVMSIVEAGLFNGAFSAGQQTSLNNNQHNFYGF